MKGEYILMYVLVFVLGFMVSRMMGGRLVEEPYKPEPLKPGDPCLFNQQCMSQFCDLTNKVECIPHGRCN